MLYLKNRETYMKTINYHQLNETEINESLFANFNRYQEVTKCWRKENGQWILKDIAFTEQWGPAEYSFLVKCLVNTVKTGGCVLGAYDHNKLIGFASVENEFFGSKKEYLQLSSLHISHDYRGKGIGKNLFSLAGRKAKELGAQKLYISAHSSQETQAFYRALGCIEAEEYNEELVAAEPCDCQLEYRLNEID